MNDRHESASACALTTDSEKATAAEPIQSLDSLPTDEFLRVVGLRVRKQRSALSMSRKRLAVVSGVSERYLAQLESGQGNMSIALLRKVTSAIGVSLAALLSAEVPNDDASNTASVNGHSHSSASISSNGAIHTAHGTDQTSAINNASAQLQQGMVTEL